VLRRAVVAECNPIGVVGADRDRYIAWALALSRCSAAVANYCDHVEHNEFADVAWVLDSAEELRSMAYAIAAAEQLDLRASYAARLRVIETRSPHWTSRTLDGGALVDTSATWRDLQLAQAQHDRYYHPDVSGLTKLDQLRHYALHIAKLAGAIADVAQTLAGRDDFLTRRLPDLLLFGLKLSSVCGERLSEESLPTNRRAGLTAA
jgi:hypothetical protein